MTIYSLAQRKERAVKLAGTFDIEGSLDLIDDERKRKVIRMRLGIGCDPLTYAQIESEIGVTRERIRQMEKEAFAEIRSKKPT